MNSSKRAQSDLRRLSRKFNVEVPDDSKCNEFTVDFIGPNDTPYSGGLWKINVRLPEQYPFKSPSIGFKNKIFHPNVDEGSGSICMDVINQTWTPMFDLINVFEVFLPQLLAYPNPASPLNGEAATLLMADEGKYERRVKEHVRQYAPGSKRTKTLATSSSHSPSSSNNGQGKKRNSDISRPIVGVPAYTRTSTSHSVQSQPQNLSTVATTTTGLEPSSFAYSLDSSTGYTTHTSLSASSANSISDSNSNGNSNNCFSPADTITNTSNNIFMSISTHSNKYSHSNSSGIRMTNNSPSMVGMDSNTNMFASVGSADHDMNGDAQAVHVSHSPKLDRECANKTPLTETAYRSLSTSDGVGTTTAIAVGMEVDPDGMDMNMSARRIFESADDLEFWASISDVSDMSDEEY